MDLDTFENSHSLSMDLLDTDVFFSTEQLGVSELDMAGLTDVDLATLDTKLADHQLDSSNWSDSVDIDLKPSDLVQFGDEGDQSLAAESDTSNSGPGCLDDDFQKMLTDWENHIGTLSASTSEQDTSLEQCSDTAELENVTSEASPVVTLAAPVSNVSSVRMATARQLPVSLRTHVVPKPGVTYTRVGGSFPRVVTTTSRISHSIHSPTSPPPLQVRSKVSLVSSKDWQSSSSSNCPVATLPDNVKFSNCTVSDLSRTLENQKRRMQWLESNFNRNSVNQTRGRNQGSNSSVKIIAAVSPGKNGQSTTRILSTKHDSLPRELIEKIKAASQGRKTIAIIEPINKEKPLPSNFQPQPRVKSTSSSWVTASSQSKWRHVGIVNPIQSQNMPDHDYCSPSKSMAPVKYTKVIRNISSPVLVKSEPSNSRGRDSGLESDGSDNSEDGGLYDKLPPYLTSVSVQTGHDPDTDNDVHYSRVPLYMTTVPSTRQSLLKYNSNQVAIKQGQDIFITKTGADTFIEEARESSSERELEESDNIIVRQRKRSRSTSRENHLKTKSNSVGGIKYRRINGHQRTKIWRNNDLERKEERRNVVEQRKIVYVGKIEEGTLKADLRQRFQKFGTIVDVSVHFRERGDNYAFITFANKEDAYEAVEHGNDDQSQPIYDLCFGGRRDFCKEKYFDMDLVDEKKGVDDLDFDSLLEAARVSNS